MTIDDGDQQEQPKILPISGDAAACAVWKKRKKIDFTQTQDAQKERGKD